MSDNGSPENPDQPQGPEKIEIPADAQYVVCVWPNGQATPKINYGGNPTAWQIAGLAIHLDETVRFHQRELLNNMVRRQQQGQRIHRVK